MRKYVSGFVRYLLFYLAGFLIFYLMRYCVSAVLTMLSEELPKLFVIENPIKDREAYDNQQLNLAFISGIITLYIVTNLAVKYDNERFEHVVEKTEGFYTLRDGYAFCSPFRPFDELTYLVSSGIRVETQKQQVRAEQTHGYSEQ